MWRHWRAITFLLRRFLHSLPEQQDAQSGESDERQNLGGWCFEPKLTVNAVDGFLFFLGALSLFPKCLLLVLLVFRVLHRFVRFFFLELTLCPGFLNIRLCFLDRLVISLERVGPSEDVG